MNQKQFSWSVGLVALLGIVSLSLGAAWAAEGETISLFNGRDLSGWKTFVDPNKDVSPDEIWSIEDGVIHCRGQVNGYLLTEKEYDNYVLRLQWKWGEKPGNSGVFVHVVGEDKIWPKGVEAQLMSGRAGDFWLVDGAKLTIDEDRRDPKTERHFFRTKDDVEKPVGQWNQYEITCDGDEIRLVVNGHEVNTGTNSELKRGRILLQSEGAEVFFRNIELEPLK